MLFRSKYHRCIHPSAPVADSPAPHGVVTGSFTACAEDAVRLELAAFRGVIRDDAVGSFVR